MWTPATRAKHNPLACATKLTNGTDAALMAEVMPATARIERPRKWSLPERPPRGPWPAATSARRSELAELALPEHDRSWVLTTHTLREGSGWPGWELNENAKLADDGH